MSVTIVIATVGRPDCVLSCVRRLREVGVPPEVEVLVVDAAAGSAADRTDPSDLAKAWPNSRVAPCEVRNAGVQRNTGVKQAAHDIIIFLDDDCLVQPGWWPAIIEPMVRSEFSWASDTRVSEIKVHSSDSLPEFGRQMTNPELSNERITGSRISNPESRTAAVAGGVWVNPNPKLTDKRGGYVNWRGEPIQVTHRGAGAPRWVDWPLTTNMAVRRNAFLEVGGFSPVYGIYDEDVDFGLKIRRAGYRIAFAPEAAVYHYFLKRPRQPPTKAAAFRDGRNRAILLVRNYGRSARLPLFLLTAPWIRGWEALCASALCCLKQAGHYAAYLAGIAAGLVVGARNQAERDRRP